MSAPVVQIFETGDYDAQVSRAAELLNSGSLIVLPTETVYGLAARLDRPQAMSRLRALRPTAEPKPFTLHLAHRHEAERYLGSISELGRRMIQKLWPGPVALMFDVPSDRQAVIAAELGVAPSDLYDGDTITLRCPDHILATDVIAQTAGPVVATAAGASLSSSAADIARELEGKADLVFDAGPPRYHKPSTIVRVHGEHYEIVRAGVYDSRIIDRLLRTTILFVCSGNTCRSPMAEALARGLLAEKLHVPPEDLEKKGVSVLSAGSFAMPGARATPQAVEAVKNLGADLSRHRSRPLTVELIHQADMIFAMSRNHRQAITAWFPPPPRRFRRWTRPATSKTRSAETPGSTMTWPVNCRTC